MSNPNYVRGRAFEYETMKNRKEEMGHDVMRTAGSHGLFDIISISKDGDIHLIQCKTVQTEKEALSMIRDFKKSPPLGSRSRAEYYQTISVKIKGGKILEGTI